MNYLYIRLFDLGKEVSEFVYYEDNKIIAESINLRLFNLSIK